MLSRARFLPLARRKLRLCSANHRPGYCTVWAYSEQETENGPWTTCWTVEFCSFPFSSQAVPSTPSYPWGPLHLRPICQRFLTTQVDFLSLRVLDSIDLWLRLVQSTEKPTVTSSDKQLGWSLGYHWHCRWPSANLASEFALSSLWVQRSCHAFHLGTSRCWKLTLIPAWISNNMPS